MTGGTKSWYMKFKYPWWGQVMAAVLVLVSVIPIPLYFFKNWPKNGFQKIKENLSNVANFYPDPSWREPERRIPPKEMERLIREEDRNLLRKNIASGDFKLPTA